MACRTIFAQKDAMPGEYRQIEWDEASEDDCRHLVRLAVREDLARQQDWTTLALVDHGRTGQAAVVARSAGTVAGLEAARVALDEMAPAVQWSAEIDEGSRVGPSARVAVIAGPARDLLTCERIVLNFLQRLSGIATLTQQFVEAVAGTSTRIYDTRKTTPGWRRLEKWAVRCGGGRNHRGGLYDAILIKDNHLALGEGPAGDRRTPAEAVNRARQFLDGAAAEPSAGQALNPRMPIEVEVDTLAQLKDVLAAEPDVILLDNMAPDELRQAVALRDGAAPGVELEASGGVDLGTVRAIAQTGVNRISVGRLTHSAPALDLGLDWIS